MKENKLLFEAEVCSRCGGTGSFSYCQSHGTRCFKCAGRGWTLTKRGQAAQGFLNWLRVRPIRHLQPGDAYWKADALGLCYGNVINERWTVQSVEQTTAGEVGYVQNPERVVWRVVTDKGTQYGFDTCTEQVILPVELQKVAVAAALELQSQLNKSGKYSRRKQHATA